MDRVKGWWKRVRAVVWRGRAERELRDEFAFHVEQEIAHNVARGMTPAEARRAAYVAFGGVERHAARVREAREFGWFEALVQDARHAVRSYRRAPGFTLVVVVTLALGIGGATAIFSVVDAVVLRPLPYAEPDRLVHVWETNPAGQDFSVSEPNFVDFATSNRTLTGLGAYRLDAVTLSGEAPVQLTALVASRSLAAVLGVRLIAGRVYDEGASAAAEVVLSEGFWRRRFGGAAVLGTELMLEGEPHVVVGVLAAETNFLRADVWTPLNAAAHGDRGDHWLGMVGRLAPGVTREEASADLARVAASIGLAHPQVAGWGVRVRPLSERLIDERLRGAGLLLLAAVAFLLLIACANVTNLLLARATSRQTDLSVRVALGAGIARVTRQSLTESVLLVSAGAAAGVLGAYWAVNTFRAAALRIGGPQFLPRVEDVAIDGRILLFSLLVTVMTALLVGLLPARAAARVDVHSVLKHGGRTGAPRSQQFARDALVVSQIGFAVLLLIGGGLMVRSLLRLHTVETGLATERLWSVRLQPLETHYPEEWQRARFYNVVSERLRRVPGVVAAGATNVDPFTGMNLVNDVTPEERAAVTPPSGFMQAAWRVVTADGYFAAAGIPVVRGRTFSFEQDRYDAARSVIITQSLADRLWPGEDPVGRRLYWGGTTGRTRTVVGVTADIRDVDLDGPVQPLMFLPATQLVWPWMVVLVRTSGDVEGVTAAIRAAIREVDANILVPEIRRVHDSRAALLAQPTFQAWALAAFATVALSLAAIGLYGVLAFAVTQRRREIGVRMALGARADSVLRLMVRRGLLLTGIGLLCGLAAGAALTRTIRSLLYDVAPLDPVTFVGVPVLLGIVGVVAASVPAWRAARVDPVAVLRE